MKKVFLAIVFLMSWSFSASAQSSGVGFLIGASDPLEDGFDLDLDDSVREVFYMTELEEGTAFKIKVGQIESELVSFDDPSVIVEEKTEYVSALIEYRFYEVFGSTGLFAGPGFYRRRVGTTEETDYGISGGVNGTFPISRRFAVVAEAAYHWSNFDEGGHTFLTATGGIKINF